MSENSDFKIENGVLLKYTGSDKIVELPETVTRISDKAFMDNLFIEEIKFPEVFERIGKYAFMGCRNLKSVKIPKGVFKLAAYAFKECDKLKEVELPDTLEILSRESFADCISLEKIVIPDSVTIMEEEIFSGCKKLESAILPKVLEKLPGSTFENCENLTYVKLPENLKRIEYCDFFSCKSLEKIVFPKTLQYIGPSAFEKCSGLKEVDLSEVECGNTEENSFEIDEDGFADCVNLETVLLPQYFSLWTEAFYNCRKIKNTNFSKKSDAWRHAAKLGLFTKEQDETAFDYDWDNKNEKFIFKDFTLTPEMKDACEEFLHGDRQIVWVYGSAGTGKSTFMRYVINEICDEGFKNGKYDKYNLGKDIVRLAPTGAAAMLIEGSTIHSFFQLPVIKNSVFEPHDFKYYTDRINRGRMDIWDCADYLIIDEVSMVRADIFDEIDRRMRCGKDNLDEPFGGVKILLLGDPFQLPPVLTQNDEEAFTRLGYTTPYFFSSRIYKELLFKNKVRQIEFKKIFRQTDEKFLTTLNHIRLGEANQEDLNYINSRVRTQKPEEILHLTTTRNHADSINMSKYNEIDSEEFVFNASATGKLYSPLEKALSSVEPNYGKDFPAPPVLKLKAGTHILLLTNENNFVNGTLATIKKIEEDLITACDQEHKYLIRRHKWEEKEYVRGENGLELEIVATYTQFPLVYGWAMTIHKAQGKTVENISVSLENGTFAFGQSYVALSRVRSIEGLHLENRVRMEDIKQNKTVLNYFDYCRNHNLV